MFQSSPEIKETVFLLPFRTAEATRMWGRCLRIACGNHRVKSEPGPIAGLTGLVSSHDVCLSNSNLNFVLSIKCSDKNCPKRAAFWNPLLLSQVHHQGLSLPCLASAFPGCHIQGVG